MKYLNIEFLDNFYDNRKVVQFDESKSLHYVTKVNSKNYELMNDTNIEFHLTRQDKYRSAIEKKRIQMELEQQQIESERIELIKLNGFISQLKTDLQKGKANKHLTSTLVYNDKIVKHYSMIEDLLSVGYTPVYKEYTQWSKNDKWISKKAYVMENDSVFVEVSKTQFDYAMYLMNEGMSIAI